MKSTVTGNAETIKKILTNKPQYKECLFSRGYLITEDNLNVEEYPFYNLWKTEKIGKYTAFVHKDQDHCLYDRDGVSFLIVGHAYNPFNEIYDEETLLSQAADAYFQSKEVFFECINESSSIFWINVVSVEE